MAGTRVGVALRRLGVAVAVSGVARRRARVAVPAVELAQPGIRRGSSRGWKGGSPFGSGTAARWTGSSEPGTVRKSLLAVVRCSKSLWQNGIRASPAACLVARIPVRVARLTVGVTLRQARVAGRAVGMARHATGVAHPAASVSFRLDGMARCGVELPCVSARRVYGAEVPFCLEE